MITWEGLRSIPGISEAKSCGDWCGKKSSETLGFFHLKPGMKINDPWKTSGISRRFLMFFDGVVSYSQSPKIESYTKIYPPQRRWKHLRTHGLNFDSYLECVSSLTQVRRIFSPEWPARSHWRDGHRVFQEVSRGQSNLTCFILRSIFLKTVIKSNN